MRIFEHQIIESVTEIKTTTEKIWEFFYRIEENYKKWHPECHHYWHWSKGNPLEIGSKIDSEETIGGHKSRIKATIIESVKNQKIAFKPVWPLAMMCPKIEWVFETRGEKILFIARTHYRFGKLYRMFQKNAIKEIVSLTKKHMDEEGDHLKKILE